MDDIRVRRTPSAWVEALDRAEADVAARRVVDGAEVHADIADRIERLKLAQTAAGTSSVRDER